jgi:small subunit ribosomal protein S21
VTGGQRTFYEKGFDGVMIKVTARPHESVEQLVKRFKKICENEGLTKDIKRTSYYEKPSERKRRRQRKVEKRLLQLERFGPR